MSRAADRPLTRKRRDEEAAGHDDSGAESVQRASGEAHLAAASSTLVASPITSTSSGEPVVPHAGPSACAADDRPESARAAAGGVRPLPEQLSQRKRPRLSPGFACDVDRLATVELQLVLQWLDMQSKLMAARCSRRLLQAASHPFAWQGPSLRFESHDHPRLGTLASRSLLRHAPIALGLTRGLSPAQVALIPRLRELTATVPLTPELLALPALQGLQTLRLPYHLSGSDLQRLTFLPRLHTLHLYAWTSDDWSWLPAMPVLTDLSFSHLPSSFSPIHEAIGQCERLHSLQLLAPIFQPGTFVRLCSTAAMTRLRHLRLEHFWLSHARLAEDEWRIGISQLAQLELLRLHEVRRVDLLLPPLVHAPNLRTCALTTAPYDAHPNAAMLRQLLTAAPRLHLRLHAATTIERWRTSHKYQQKDQSATDREHMDRQWHRLQRMAQELERVTVVDEEPM